MQVEIKNKLFGAKGFDISRGNPLANPYLVHQSIGANKLEMYSAWFLYQIKIQHPDVCGELAMICHEVVTTGSATLICNCLSRKCHGLVIAGYIKMLMEHVNERPRIEGTEPEN